MLIMFYMTATDRDTKSDRSEFVFRSVQAGPM